MSKLAILGVLLGTLVTGALTSGCAEPYYPHHGYGYARGYGYGGYHHYWRNRGSWRHGYWNNGVFVNSYIYVDPTVALPQGVVIAPGADTDTAIVAPNAQNTEIPPGSVINAAGQIVTPSGMVITAPNVTAGATLAAPGMIPPTAYPVAP